MTNRDRAEVRARLVQVGIDALLELEPADLLGSAPSWEAATEHVLGSDTIAGPTQDASSSE